MRKHKCYLALTIPSYWIESGVTDSPLVHPILKGDIVLLLFICFLSIGSRAILSFVDDATLTLTVILICLGIK